MHTKLYVDNLATTATYTELMDLFSVHGNVSEVNLPLDHASGRPRGFGFVTMATPEGAHAAIAALHGKAMGTKLLTVIEAAPPGGRKLAPSAGRNPRRTIRNLY